MKLEVKVTKISTRNYLLLNLVQTTVNALFRCNEEKSKKCYPLSTQVSSSSMLLMTSNFSQILSIGRKTASIRVERMTEPLQAAYSTASVSQVTMLS